MLLGSERIAYTEPTPLYSVLAGATFDLTVSGTTALGTPPAGAAGVVFTVTAGDIYGVIGATPTTGSPPYGSGAQLKITPLADAVAFRAIIKQGAPHLVGQWLKRDN